MIQRLSKEDINALPLFHYDGEVSLVRTEEECLAAVEKIRDYAAIGVDTETRPSFLKGKSYAPALVQIAVPGTVYLFQLAWVPFGPLLASLFEDPAITKAGVAVHDDLRSLMKIHHFQAQSVCDLGDMAKVHGIQNHGLRGLAGYFLRVRVSKGERCSNWSNKELSLRQIRYAATDAWASLAIYSSMQSMGLI